MASKDGQRGRGDWVDAGLRTLAQGGVDAVRVEVLARELAVTKGSFYWHFRDRADLLRVLLAEWEEQRTDRIILDAEKDGGGPATRLLSLMHAAARGDAQLELRVRIWGTMDAEAAAAVGRADRRRLGYLVELFRELGFPPSDANMRARAVYLARLGQLLLPNDGLATSDEDAFSLLHAVLTQPVVANPVDAHDRAAPAEVVGPTGAALLPKQPSQFPISDPDLAQTRSSRICTVVVVSERSSPL